MAKIFYVMQGSAKEILEEIKNRFGTDEQRAMSLDEFVASLCDFNGQDPDGSYEEALKIMVSRSSKFIKAE